MQRRHIIGWAIALSVTVGAGHAAWAGHDAPRYGPSPAPGAYGHRPGTTYLPPSIAPGQAYVLGGGDVGYGGPAHVSTCQPVPPPCTPPAGGHHWSGYRGGPAGAGYVPYAQSPAPFSYPSASPYGGVTGYGQAGYGPSGFGQGGYPPGYSTPGIAQPGDAQFGHGAGYAPPLARSRDDDDDAWEEYQERLEEQREAHEDWLEDQRDDARRRALLSRLPLPNFPFALPMMPR